MLRVTEARDAGHRLGLERLAEKRPASFIKNHLGINANVQIEPPAGTFVAA